VETIAVGKVVVPARIERLEDLFMVEQGTLATAQVRRVDVADALVDTGATMLSLPTRLIDQLGLKRYKTRRVRTSAGVTQTSVCEAVRLTIQSRDCIVEVSEVPDECPVLVGQVPLELLDFVVDPVGQRLIGNPEHGGEQMFDLF
jgi:predicted aspartyl protease